MLKINYQFWNQELLRQTLWRVGRKIYLLARGELSTEPKFDGEFNLLQIVIPNLTSNKFIFFDIGANTGLWMDEVRRLSDDEDKNIDLYAIEPCSTAYHFLQTIYGGTAQCFHLAMGAESGITTLNIYGDRFGINSIYSFPNEDVIGKEEVAIETFDRFCLSNGISDICYVKSDTEGNCLNVLRGANQAFLTGSIMFWQFEYNHRWLFSGSSMLALFKWISDKPYFVGKFYRNKICIYSEWHFELDRFLESNFILIRKDCLEILGGMIEFCKFNDSNVPENLQMQNDISVARLPGNNTRNPRLL